RCINHDGGALIGTNASAFDVTGNADTAIDAARSQRLLLSPEGVVPNGRERLVEGFRKIPGVIDERLPVPVQLPGIARHLLRLDEIAAPELSRIEMQGAGEPIDNAVHDEHRLGASSPTVWRVR